MESHIFFVQLSNMFVCHPFFLTAVCTFTKLYFSFSSIKNSMEAQYLCTFFTLLLIIISITNHKKLHICGVNWSLFCLSIFPYTNKYVNSMAFGNFWTILSAWLNVNHDTPLRVEFFNFLFELSFISVCG